MATTFKVATLIIKTLVKPIANQLKKNAVHEGWFRDSCHWAGQVSNTVLTHVQLRSMGHKVKKIKPLPTDDAVKAGADIFAEAMVLTTGMVVIGLEVVRKMRADKAAAIKAEHDELILKEKKELKLLEKERVLREQLHGLEARMIDVENAKFATLHEKLLHEQQKHLLVTENLLKRIHYLENQLKIVTPYPLLPSHRPPSLQSNQQHDKQQQQLRQQQGHQPSAVTQAAAAALSEADAQAASQSQPTQQPQSLYQSMRDQTNKLFSYSLFFQSDPSSTPPAASDTAVDGKTAATNPTQKTLTQTTPLPTEAELAEAMMEAEQSLVRNLLDTQLPDLSTITHSPVAVSAATAAVVATTTDGTTPEPTAQGKDFDALGFEEVTLTLAHGAADLLMEASTLPEEEHLDPNDEFDLESSPVSQPKAHQHAGNPEVDGPPENEQDDKKRAETEEDLLFPSIKPAKPVVPVAPHLAEHLPPVQPVPSHKAHLSVKLHV